MFISDILTTRGEKSNIIDFGGITLDINQKDNKQKEPFQIIKKVHFDCFIFECVFKWLQQFLFSTKVIFYFVV